MPLEHSVCPCYMGETHFLVLRGLVCSISARATISSSHLEACPFQRLIQKHKAWVHLRMGFLQAKNKPLQVQLWPGPLVLSQEQAPDISDPSVKTRLSEWQRKVHFKTEHPKVCWWGMLFLTGLACSLPVGQRVPVCLYQAMLHFCQTLQLFAEKMTVTFQAWGQEPFACRDERRPFSQLIPCKMDSG